MPIIASIYQWVDEKGDNLNRCINEFGELSEMAEKVGYTVYSKPDLSKQQQVVKKVYDLWQEILEDEKELKSEHCFSFSR